MKKGKFLTWNDKVWAQHATSLARRLRQQRGINEKGIVSRIKAMPKGRHKVGSIGANLTGGKPKVDVISEKERRDFSDEGRKKGESYSSHFSQLAVQMFQLLVIMRMF